MWLHQRSSRPTTLDQGLKLDLPGMLMLPLDRSTLRLLINDNNNVLGFCTTSIVIICWHDDILGESASSYSHTGLNLVHPVH